MRRGLSAATLAVTGTMIALMLFYGWEMWHLAWARNWKSETVMAIPLAIPYLAIPLGFALFLLQLLGDLWMVLSGAPIDEKGMAATSSTSSLEDL